MANVQKLFHSLHTAGVVGDHAAFESAVSDLLLSVLDDASNARLFNTHTLDLAIGCGSARVVSSILSSGENVRCHPAQLRSALRAQSGGAQLVATMQRGGSRLDINYLFNDGRTLLHDAAEMCHDASAIKMLLQLGSDPSAVSSDGCTPAATAASCNNDVAMRVFRSRGVDLSRGSVDSLHGVTPLTAALEARAGTSMRYLLCEAAVPVTKTFVRGRPVLHWLVDSAPQFVLACSATADAAASPPASPFALDPLSACLSPSSDAETVIDCPLVSDEACAVATANAPRTRRNLGPSASSGFAFIDEFRLNDGGPALHLPGCEAPPAKPDCASHVDALGWFIQAGADVAAVEPCTGLTPLHVACTRHDAAAARLLLQAGASPFAAAPDGRLPHQLVDITAVTTTTPTSSGAAEWHRSPAHEFLAEYATALLSTSAGHAHPELLGNLNSIRLQAVASAASACRAAPLTRGRLFGRPGLTVLSSLRAS